MKDRLIGFIKTYCLFVCIFVLQKPLFMLFYKSLYPDASCADWFSVIWHGLPLDLSLAGYLTAIPGFLFITSVWTLSKSLYRIWCSYLWGAKRSDLFVGRGNSLKCFAGQWVRGVA